MRIGYSVEGSTDRAFIGGLRERWCPGAELVEGRFRGSTEVSLRRGYQKICDEFSVKRVDVMVFLTDANEREWREVQREGRAKFPPECLDRAIHGVADRNIECWLCAEPGWLGSRLGVAPEQLRCDDPKGVFERAVGVNRDDHKEEEIAQIVKDAPLKSWLDSPSFEDFYRQAWHQSKQAVCTIENLREP
ncbi:MAG: hypothetical protein NTX53_12300 [candidate division WOR-3 bacterium]|nr:hypothetical protein [candidate division WOR-3 bacterium]